MSGNFGPLVEADELDDLGEVVFADVRWYLDGRSGAVEYEKGHLPGAVFVDLDADLAEGAGGTRGRHPLPSPELFAGRLGALGIGDDATVVAYDDTGGGTAGRLVVMLRAIGQRAALLDGGIAAYSGALETGGPTARPARERNLTPWPSSLVVSIEEVAEPGSSVLLDARAPERYLGETEPVDPRPGHIPGARNLPWMTLLDPATGRFRSRGELAARFSELGIDAEHPLIALCGSGVTACALLIGAEAAGVDGTRLFAPSYSAWSSDRSRPVATGRE